MAEQRCDLTELPVTGCAHCRPAPAPAPTAGRELGPWFDATYHGDCADCGGAIEPGDRIRADGAGGWLCDTCGDTVSDGESVWDLFS